MNNPRTRYLLLGLALASLCCLAAVTVQDGLLNVTRFTPRPGIGTNRVQFENTNAQPVVYFDPTNSGGTLVTSNLWVRGTQTNSSSLDVYGSITTLGGAFISPVLVNEKVLTSDPTGEISESAVTTTELGYLAGVTSPLQTQLAGKQPGNTNLTNIANGNWQTNFLLLKPTAAKMANTNSAYADNSLPTGFLAFPHTNGVGSVVSLGATFDQLVLPPDYATNTLAFEFGVMNTATNGPNASNFVFLAEVLRHNHTGQTSTNDAQVGPFDAGLSAYTVTVDASYTGTNKVQWVSGTISNCTLAANESFSLRLWRANTNASDLVGTGVAAVTAARLRYTWP